MAEDSTVRPEWKLYYWYGLPGRGDFVRLMFEEAGVPYDDVCVRDKNSAAAVKFYKGEHEGFPILAPPIIQHGDFVMCHTPAILQYLGKKFGMYPEGGPEVEANAMQVTLGVADYLGEGHDVFHPVKKTGSYDSQKDEAQPFIEQFKKERMPRYLKHFETVLRRNNGGDGFFFGQNITFVDIAVYHALRATDSQFPEEYLSLTIPLLKAFKERMDARDRISSFLTSDRCQKFCGNSMM